MFRAIAGDTNRAMHATAKLVHGTLRNEVLVRDASIAETDEPASAAARTPRLHAFRSCLETGTRYRPFDASPKCSYRIVCQRR
jgi:hypothetical protein